MRNHIRFLVNGREHRVAGAAAFATLANYLRYDAAATGTKIVCEEGDCGACSVLIRRGEPASGPATPSSPPPTEPAGASSVRVEGGGRNAGQGWMGPCHGAQCG